MSTRQLGNSAITAFQRRGICVEQAAKLGVFTARRDVDGAAVPDPSGNIVAFPYFERGAQVACKYRAPGKEFFQDTGGRRTLYNSDVLDDPALERGDQPLIIVEGEIDCLSALSCGFPFVVSVPDGAPAVPKDRRPDDLDPLDPEAEQTNKFEFLWNNRERLARIRRFVIAVDSDEPGQRLAAELVRRLNPARCSFVTYPDERIIPVAGEHPRPCKDLNDVLMALGADRVTQVLSAAKPYPVRGLYKLTDYPPAGELETFTTGFDEWSKFCRLFVGEFIVVTGIPTHGKSLWALSLLTNLAWCHKWRSAIFSPEMRTVPILRDHFRRRFLQRKPIMSEPTENARADAWINAHFSFIDSDPVGFGEADEPFDLDWILDRAKDAVLRDGIRVLLIDPWNEIEHARERNESLPEYIARSIRALKRFARLYGVIVIVVAHPTKDVAIGGKVRVPTLYDIDGAAHWFNKSDHGIVIERPGGKETTVVHVQKVKFQPETGVRSKLTMEYDRETGRYGTQSCEMA